MTRVIREKEDVRNQTIHRFSQIFHCWEEQVVRIEFVYAFQSSLSFEM